MARNERIIGGNIQYRRFAYLHKTNREKFGVLDAVDYRDARYHLGSSFHIRQTWLTPDEDSLQMTNRDKRFEIVSSIFLNPASVGFCGSD
jgi:hypothetical protein